MGGALHVNLNWLLVKGDDTYSHGCNKACLERLAFRIFYCGMFSHVSNVLRLVGYCMSNLFSSF
jgi:hypothetical protein